MTFKESVSVCLKKKYVSIEGRASRSEYWWFFLFTYLVVFVCALLGVRIGELAAAALLLPSITVGIRRMHDVGKSGWWILIPVLNVVYVCTESEIGVNDYGDMPE